MVLRFKDLQNDLHMTPYDLKEVRRKGDFYSRLNWWRAKAMRETLEATDSAVEVAKTMHYSSIAFVEAAKNNQRQEALQFLYEINRVAWPAQSFKFGLDGMRGVSGSFVDGSDMRQNFYTERKQRLQHYYDKQKQRRQIAQEKASVIPDKEEQTIFLLESGGRNTSHYDVLGVPQTATIEDIQRAFRRLAKIHHPDKNKVSESWCFFGL